jgi:hypothetical protein
MVDDSLPTDGRHQTTGDGLLFCVVSWLVVVVGLLWSVRAFSQVGGGDKVALALLFTAWPGALWTTRRTKAVRRIRATVPDGMLSRRLHGNLDAVGDDAGRALRPIGVAPATVAAKTATTLARLADRPGVRVFHGVRAADPTLGHVAHAVVAGRDLVLVEAVAWPSGLYQVQPDGQVTCDNVRIGQSVAPLRAAVRYWKGTLPWGHRVRAMVVVHGCGESDPHLPPSDKDLAWVPPENVIEAVGQRIDYRGRSDTRTVVALVTATRY